MRLRFAGLLAGYRYRTDKTLKRQITTWSRYAGVAGGVMPTDPPSKVRI